MRPVMASTTTQQMSYRMDGNALSGSIQPGMVAGHPQQNRLVELIVQFITLPITIPKWWIQLFYKIQPEFIQNIFESFFFEIETQVIPSIQGYVGYFVHTILPFVFSTKPIQLVVPYAIWRMIVPPNADEITQTGNMTQKELVRVTKELAQASMEKNALLDVSNQNTKLQAENDALKTKLRNYGVAV